MAGMAEFNIVAPGDAITQEQRMEAKPQDPVVQAAVMPDAGKRVIQGEPTPADRAETVSYSLQEPGGILGDIMGACNQLACDVDQGLTSVLHAQAPAPADGQQPAAAEPDTLAQQAAVLEANNTTWTHKAQFNMPNGPGMA